MELGCILDSTHEGSHAGSKEAGPDVAGAEFLSETSASAEGRSKSMFISRRILTIWSSGKSPWPSSFSCSFKAPSSIIALRRSKTVDEKQLKPNLNSGRTAGNTCAQASPSVLESRTVSSHVYNNLVTRTSTPWLASLPPKVHHWMPPRTLYYCAYWYHLSTPSCEQDVEVALPMQVAVARPEGPKGYESIRACSG